MMICDFCKTFETFLKIILFEAQPNVMKPNIIQDAYNHNNTVIIWVASLLPFLSYKCPLKLLYASMCIINLSHEYILCLFYFSLHV